MRLYLCGVRSKAAPEKRGNKSKAQEPTGAAVDGHCAAIACAPPPPPPPDCVEYLPTSRPEKHPSFFNAVHFKDTPSLLFPTTTTGHLFSLLLPPRSHTNLLHADFVCCVRALQFLKSIAISHATITLNVCWAANIQHLSQFQHCY